jgi:hypothetical protein
MTMSGMGEHESDTAAGQITADHASLDRASAVQSSLLPSDLLNDTGAHDVAMAGINVTFNLIDASESRTESDGVNFDQEGVTLSFDDVLSIGTETIGDLQALVVTGDEGDLVRLRNDPDHSWQIATMITVPDGFTAYQAVTNTIQDHAGQDHAGQDHAGPAHGGQDHASHDQVVGHEIYVLVQHDLQVLLNAEQTELT